MEAPASSEIKASVMRSANTLPLQAAAVDGGHSVGDDVQLVPPADQFLADRLRMRQGIDPGTQGSEVIPVALVWVPRQLQRLKKAHKTLQRHIVLGDLSPVKGCPQLLVDPVVEGAGIQRIRNAVAPAHGGKGTGRGFWKVEQGVIRVKEQIGKFHGEDSFRESLTTCIVSHPNRKGNHRRPRRAYHGLRGNAG